MNSKITVGVTGGIGSGKSFICKILENMGYPVFYADKSAKSLLISSSSLISGIKNLIGEEAYLHNGQIDRKFIASKIFEDDSKLAAMNALVHPAVRNAFKAFVSLQDSTIVFNEAAIIFETGSYDQFDCTVLVTAPHDTKFERILKREAITQSQIEARMSKQWSDERKIPLADYVISNGKGDMLLPQINKVLSSLVNFNKVN